MKKLRKKMRTYTNLLVICTCSLEAMIIRTGTVILDVNSGNELVSEEMINNITATKAIMVYFRKKCSITNQKVILFGCRSIGGWRISIRPDSTVTPPPLYMYTLSSVEVKNEMKLYITDQNMICPSLKNYTHKVLCIAICITIYYFNTSTQLYVF